jgi:hypothetical protein
VGDSESRQDLISAGLVSEFARLEAAVQRLIEEGERDRQHIARLTTAIIEIQGAMQRQFAVSEDLSRQTAESAQLTRQHLEHSAHLVELYSGMRNILEVQLDDISGRRGQLIATRATPEYAAALADPEPLVTVRIATFRRPDTLFDLAVPSVLAQTYKNLEVEIVCDGEVPEIARRAAELDDPRVRFVSLPLRGVYPSDPVARWQVAGWLPASEGAQLARGSWIAPLDDDDEFLPDHIEKLLAVAREGQFEVVYGRMAVVPPGDAPNFEVGVYPPVHGEFGWQSALYMAALKWFDYEPGCWAINEPADWNLCRRMMAAGIRIGFTPDVVTTIYPTGPDEV